MNDRRRRAIAALGVLLASVAVAHPPDQNGLHTIDPSLLRTWTNSKSGEVVRGAFLAWRDGRVSIEGEKGEVTVIAMADLAEPDRAEAERRIAEVKALNERLVATALGEAENAGQPGVGGRSAPEDGLGPALRSTPPAQAAPFNAFAPFVKTRWDDRWLYVESDGLPHAPGAKSAGAYAYPLMVGIKSWQQQVPLPQAYVGDNAWRIPLKPELADQAISGKTRLYRGAIALAANGVPIFNALNNRGDDAFKAGELDEYGGHCGRADDYHYHIAPLALQKVVGKNRPIAYALDGFPIFGLFDPAARAGEDKACPLGGTEKLDELNGHFGAPTPGSPSGAKGLYHYHASVLYPYINGGVRGKVTVKDDQIDPQPRANPVRQWLQPLRGAAITGFKTLGERSWSLEYTLSSKKHFVNFRIEGQGRDAKYIFEFIGPTGEKTTETYQARAPRTDRPPRDRPAGDRGGRGDRPPGDDAPRPRPPGDGEPPTLAAAPIVKPFDGFVLSSPDVTGGRLSVECTCDGNGRAPALAWEGSPKETKAFAVIVHHVPPEGGAHVYMVVANISATSGKGELKSGDTTTGTWGQNTVNRRSEYAPPCSKGPGDKVYTITLYALSTEVAVPRDRPLTRETLLAAMKDKTLATSTLDVKYARSGAGGRRGG